MKDITELLNRVRGKDVGAEAELMERVYPELRRIAARYLRGERMGHTLQPTALVNEAYLELLGQLGTDWQDRKHFYAVAAQVMRRILVDHARGRKAAKRSGSRHQVDLAEGLAITEAKLDEILFLDEALDRLAALDPRKSKVVELRFFGGFTESEVADILEVVPRTVKRDWQFAKAWLHRELHEPSPSNEA